MKLLHKIYIYREGSNLPENGWFQRCFICCTITSRTRLYDSLDKIINNKKTRYELYVYICPQCKRKLDRGDKAFKLHYKHKCEHYINKNFFRYP